MARSRAVISLLNTPAGLFRWYEEFPLLIGARLAAEGIDHVLGYKTYLPNTIVPMSPRLVAHDETDVPRERWVVDVLEPIASRYEKVIVHTHSYGFQECAVWRITRGRSNRRWWATMHRTPRAPGALKTLRRRAMQALRIGYPDRIFGVSNASASALRSMFLPSHVGVLHNGRLAAAEMNQFPPRDTPRTALFVGRLNREKGVWPLLEAGAELSRQRADFHLIIVGDGPEAAAMRDWIADRKLESRIEMTGHQSDVQPYYARADFLIVPTDPEQVSEGLPLVALEAKAYALPALYSLSGGLPETQIENRTGLVIDPLDTAHIIAAANRLMDDRAGYERMREEIRGERSRWSIDAMVDEYIRAYLAEFAKLR